MSLNYSIEWYNMYMKEYYLNEKFFINSDYIYKKIYDVNTNKHYESDTIYEDYIKYYLTY